VDQAKKTFFCVQVTVYFLPPGLLRVNFRHFNETSVICIARRVTTVMCGVILASVPVTSLSLFFVVRLTSLAVIPGY